MSTAIVVEPQPQIMPIEEIVIPPSITTNSIAINHIIKLFEAGESLPSVIIQPNKQLIEGLAVVEAAKQLGQDSLLVEVIDPKSYRGSGRREITYIHYSKLKKHPFNPLIYGENEPVDDLVLAIKESGHVDPLIVCPDPEEEGKFLLLAGNRRNDALLIIGFIDLPCEIIYPKDRDHEKALLGILNASREPNIEQRVRAGMAMEEGEKAKALERQRRGVKGESEGTVRDKIAKIVKLGSGRNYEKAKIAVLAMDAGHPKAAEIKAIVRGIRGVDKAYNLVVEQSKEPKKANQKASTINTENIEKIAEEAWNEFESSYQSGYAPFDETFNSYLDQYNLDESTETLVRKAIQYGVWIASQSLEDK
ncbi:MAG TPA: ParB N-terminal domain-containing protein [Nostocaceae cyanobacterium]|nr:ParB N-terminal domain-containing protein [Nostocaceae cyanobacterium]